MPDGKRLIVARGPVTGNDLTFGRVEIADLKGKVDRVVAKGVGINSMALSPSGNLLALSGGPREPLEIREVKSGALVRRFETGVCGYPRYEFLRDGKTIVVLASALLMEYGHIEVQTCTFPDGEPKKLIASDGASQIAVDPTGKWIAVVTSKMKSAPNQFPQPSDYRVQIYNAATGGLEQAISSGERVVGMSFSPDGSNLIVRQQNGRIDFRSTTTWLVKLSLMSQSVSQGFGFTQSTLALSADGHTLVVSLDGIGVAIYDLGNKGRLRTYYAPRRTLWRSVDLSPDGKRLAIGTTDGTVEVKSIVDGQLFSTGLIKTK